MNKSSKPIGPIAAGFAIIGIAMAYSAPSFAYPADDPLLALSGKFEIGNGESHVIADHNSPEPYRVCVAKNPESVPVEAHYDGQVRTINVGDCSDLTAKVISLSPAARLDDDAVLIGKYVYPKK